jgi:hypothetical protein
MTIRRYEVLNEPGADIDISIKAQRLDSVSLRTSNSSIQDDIPARLHDLVRLAQTCLVQR